MNLVALISELYNFQVISCVLVYDLIRDLLAGDVTELNIELLLKITRSESASGTRELCARVLSCTS
jgi:nucleolar MIF4G domain-containing protein 1